MCSCVGGEVARAVQRAGTCMSMQRGVWSWQSRGGAGRHNQTLPVARPTETASSWKAQLLLESSAPQNTGVVHDYLSSGICFLFSFVFTKLLQKFRHFPGRHIITSSDLLSLSINCRTKTKAIQKQVLLNSKNGGDVLSK